MCVIQWQNEVQVLSKAFTGVVRNVSIIKKHDVEEGVILSFKKP